MSDLTYLRIPGHWASEFLYRGSTSSGGYVYSPLGTSTPFIFGTGDWTIEFFIYIYSLSFSYGSTIIDFRSGTDGLYPVIYINTAGKLIYRTNNIDRTTGTTTLKTGQWYHIAVARASSVTRVFLNGVQEGANYADTNNYTVQSTGNPVSINRATATTTGGSCISAISNLRIEKGIGRYTSAFSIPIEPLTVTANTSLLTCMNSTLTDSSINNYQVLNYITSPGYNPQISSLTSPFGTTALDSTTLLSDTMLTVDDGVPVAIDYTTTASLDYSLNWDYRLQQNDILSNLSFNNLNTTTEYLYSSTTIDTYRNVFDYRQIQKVIDDNTLYQLLTIGSGAGGGATVKQYWS